MHEPTDQKQDITAWVLQYIFGGVVGAFAGFALVVRTDPQNGAGALPLTLAGALILAGAGSLMGDDLWHFLGGAAGGQSPGSGLAGEEPPSRTQVATGISWGSIALGVGIALWFMGTKHGWW